MKRKMKVFAIMFLACTLATPVLAGKGGGNANRSQVKSGSNSNLGTMTQRQTRQQNQYQYQMQESAETTGSKTRSQLRTRDPLTHTSDVPVGTDSLTPETTDVK